MTPVLVIAELEKEKLSPLTFELVSAASRIRALSLDTAPVDILVMVPGEQPMEAARKISAATGCKTLGVRWPFDPGPESLKQGLVHVLKDISPSYILFSHTTMGREVAPALGARLGACTMAGGTGIRKDPTGLVFTRPVMDNTRVLSLGPASTGLSILTLAPGAFGGWDKDYDGRSGEVIEMILPKTCLYPCVRQISIAGRDKGSQEIKAARIVVGAGRGIGDKENLGRVNAFAARLPGSCVGASRPLVDQGWVDYSRQVGITGTTVAPDLYIACGISGSSQHLAGMAGSKWVVSINKNSQAPICRHSDLCILADVNEFMDGFLELE